VSSIKIEVCCNSLESALNAQKGGAHRVELCSNLYEGGTTASHGEISLARELLKIDLNVLIRPRGGDFLYSETEIEIIKRDIEFCKKIGVDGVVIGFLLAEGSIDLKLTEEITKLARPMSVTFHRAFDMCNDPHIAMEELIKLGVDRILTSGMANKSTEGIDILSKLVVEAKARIIIMPGSGIRSHNIEDLINKTSASEYHVSERITIESKMTFRREGIYMGGLKEIPEYSIKIIDENKIQEIVNTSKLLSK